MTSDIVDQLTVGAVLLLVLLHLDTRNVKMREGKIGESEKIRREKVLHLAGAQTPLFINTEVLGALLPGLQKRRISLDNGARCMKFISLSRIVTTQIPTLKQI